MTKIRVMPKNHWDWSMSVPFSQGWKINDMIFVGGQVSADSQERTTGAGDIEVQTRNVFDFIKRVLEEAGGDLSDIVKLNTYYQFEGEGHAITELWEKMTEVGKEYLADPGPVGTAVRVKGFAYEDLLIEIEAIAIVGRKKVRLMPPNHWDWSIPVSFSQGWKVDDLIFVGGQISADDRGRTVAPGDIKQQIRNIFGFIQSTLREGGADLADLIKFNTYYTGRNLIPAVIVIGSSSSIECSGVAYGPHMVFRVGGRDGSGGCDHALDAHGGGASGVGGDGQGCRAEPSPSDDRACSVGRGARKPARQRGWTVKRFATGFSATTRRVRGGFTTVGAAVGSVVWMLRSWTGCGTGWRLGRSRTGTGWCVGARATSRHGSRRPSG